MTNCFSRNFYLRQDQSDLSAFLASVTDIGCQLVLFTMAFDTCVALPPGYNAVTIS